MRLQGEHNRILSISHFFHFTIKTSFYASLCFCSFSKIVTAFFPLPTICNCQQKIAIFLCNNVLLSFLLFVSCMGSRLFSANTVSTNPAFVSRLHASSLSWWPTCWSTCCGERHCGSFWECQPGHVCNHRQVRVGQAWAEDKNNDWYKSTGFK